MKRKKQTLLWAIEGEKLPAVSYLFGTMHMRDARAFTHLGQAEKALTQVDAFAAEFHLSSANLSPDTSALLLPEMTTLQDLISPKKYMKLSNILRKTTGLELQLFQHSVPFLIINLLGERFLSPGHEAALDEHLWKMAESQGKSMYGIETLEEQMAVLDKIPLQTQVKLLLDLGKNIKGFRRHLLHIVELYRQGHVNRLYQSVKKDSKGLRKLLLLRRNEIMAERIARLVLQTSVFVAIGAGHLGGGTGIIRLLKQQGLKVRPVPVPSL